MILSERERAISGFLRRSVIEWIEGDICLASHLFEQAEIFTNMTDSEFSVFINKGEI